ncbi:MAG TPA: condensation domain-containing protein, partial [Herpetosiphonaceae bacterium]
MNDLRQDIADLSPERRRLLELLRRQQEQHDRGRIRPLPRTSGPNSFPLSFAQRRLWFIDQFQPESTAYNMLSALRLTGPLDATALARALNEIVARHESLRTTFAQSAAALDGQPVQVIAPALTIELPVIDLHPEGTRLTAAERESAVQRHVLAQAQQPFDLQAGPLLRAALLRLHHAMPGAMPGALRAWHPAPGTRSEHVLVLVMHHIVADGWSQGVLIRELTTLYRAFAAGQVSPLGPVGTPLPIQYADFAVWQRQWLQGEVLERQLAYWRQQLADLPTLHLPTDHPRAAMQTITGARQIHTLTPKLTAALKALSQQEGTTLFMTLLAAFQVVLHRYTGQSDLAVGSGIANRNRAEIEGLIGFFVNTLVLRVNLAGNPSFRAALQQVREVTLAAYAHQDLPFEKLVEELQPERDLSAAPFFQVSFVLQNAPLPALHLPPLKVEPLDTEHVTTKLDLSLSVVEMAQGLRLRMQYNAALFDEPTIVRMLRHFEQVLAGIVADPDRRIGALPLLTQAEQQQMLVEWNATQRPYEVACFHELFGAHVAQTPEAVAAVYGDESLSYAELDHRANQLAHELRQRGVGRCQQDEARVGLCCERSLDLIVGMLGILKAGGAYVPLDPHYPAQRLQFMLHDSQIGVLVTQERLVAQAPAHDAAIICLDADWPQIARQPVTPPDVLLSPDHLAYVIYTSGSTGRPKGVLVTHRGLGNIALVQRQTVGVDRQSRVLQFASFSFDSAVWEVCMALLRGATLVLAPEEALRPGPDLLHLLEAEAITVATLPPSALAVLPPAELPHLTHLLVAGEACSGDLVARWARGRQMFNGYGPTETTVCATLAALDGTQRIPPIGRPIANTRIYLLDRRGQPVPVGVPGE